MLQIKDALPQEINNNPAYLNILTRTSVRKYTREPVSEDALTAILHAAMAAPSGMNKQPWEFIVIDDRELLKKLADVLPYAKMAAEAPVAVLVCGNKERILSGVDDNLWEQDCSAATENILLAAHSLGLGAVWTCLYPHEERMDPVKNILNIGDKLIPFNLIPIGHPEHEHPVIDKWHPERIHINRMP